MYQVLLGRKAMAGKVNGGQNCLLLNNLGSSITNDRLSNPLVHSLGLKLPCKELLIG